MCWTCALPPTTCAGWTRASISVRVRGERGGWSVDCESCINDDDIWHLRAGFPIEPVCIETEDGRRKYQNLQQQLYEQGMPIRRRLIRLYENFFALVEREQGSV